MFQLGFSYVGLVYLLMLFIPNMFWTKNKPVDYGKYVQNENRVLQLFERIGEALTSVCALIFTGFNIRKEFPSCILLIISFILMLLYEVYWIRYFRSEKTMSDFYSSILGIPVAGASLPVLAFLLLGAYGRNSYMIVSVVILGIGHIGIHWQHYREITNSNGKTN